MPLICSRRAARLVALILLGGACLLSSVPGSSRAQADESCPCFNTEQIVADCTLPPGFLSLFPESTIVHTSWDPDEYSQLWCVFVHDEIRVDYAGYYSGHWTTNDLSTPAFCRAWRGEQTVSEHKAITSDQLDACRQQLDDAARSLGAK